jgi:AraC-like DNA-binding protein
VTLPQGACAVLGVSALLRELILALVALPGAGRQPCSRLTSLRRLIFEELAAAPRQALGLVPPKDRRVAPLIEALLADPADPRSLADWAARLGASQRTIERIFLAETRLSFRAWRQQARLLQAVLRLAEGQPVTTVALDLGYASPSAFTFMFRRALGVPPSRYVASFQGS